MRVVTCSMPNCDCPVGYHRSKNGIKKYKTFCEKHRVGGSESHVAESWKMQQGCSNSDGHHGFVCTSLILDPCQLQVNHIDGNNRNRDQSNIECSCGNCHALVTKINGHSKQPGYPRMKDLSKEAFDANFTVEENIVPK